MQEGQAGGGKGGGAAIVRSGPWRRIYPPYVMTSDDPRSWGPVRRSLGACRGHSSGARLPRREPGARRPAGGRNARAAAPRAGQAARAGLSGPLSTRRDSRGRESREQGRTSGPLCFSPDLPCGRGQSTPKTGGDNRPAGIEARSRNTRATWLKTHPWRNSRPS